MQKETHKQVTLTLGGNITYSVLFKTLPIIKTNPTIGRSVKAKVLNKSGTDVVLITDYHNLPTDASRKVISINKETPQALLRPKIEKS